MLKGLFAKAGFEAAACLTDCLPICLCVTQHILQSWVVTCGTGQERVGRLCSDCSLGTFKSTPGDEPCSACTGTGNTTLAVGSMNSAQCLCAEGHVEMVNKCLMCPEGTFAQRGGVECLPCPAGNTSQEGAANCNITRKMDLQIRSIGVSADVVLACSVSGGIVLIIACAVLVSKHKRGRTETIQSDHKSSRNSVIPLDTASSNNEHEQHFYSPSTGTPANVTVGADGVLLDPYRAGSDKKIADVTCSVFGSCNWKKLLSQQERLLQRHLPDCLANSYRVDKVLGSGAFGVVVKVTSVRWEQIQEGDVHALKVVRANDATLTDKERRRLLREAKVMLKVSDKAQHVIALKDYGTSADDSCFWFKMEYLEGGSLLQVLGHSGPFLERDCVQVGLEVLDALDVLHQHGIAHRDVSLESVFV